MPKAKSKKRKAKKMKSAKRKQSELSLLNIKVSPADRRALDAAAKKYAGGNLSAWLRFAGMVFKPSKHQHVR